MMSKMKVFLLACCLVFTLTMGAQAGSPKIVAGLGVGAVPDYEGSDDYEAAPLLLLDVEWDNNMSISIMGNSARINLLPHPVFKAGLIMEYIAERDNDVDSPRVSLLPSVDTSFMLGGFLGFNKNDWDGSIAAMKDASDANDGTIVRANLGCSYKASKEFTTRVGVFTTWADDDYMESYFGVSTAGAAASGLTTYKAESGLKDAGLSLTLHYMPWQKWGLMGIFTYKKLLSDASDSPVVDVEGDDNQLVGGLMLTYRF